MDGDDPDLEAFESNLRRILRARALGKTADLVSNLCPNASDPQSVGVSCVSSKDDAQREPHWQQWATAAHRLNASWIQTIYQIIMKHWQNGSSKGTSTLKLTASPQGKLMKTQFGQLWRSSICQLFPYLSIAWKVFTIRQPNQTGNCWNCLFEANSELTTVKKMDRCSCFGVRKDPGLNSVAWNVHTWHSRENGSQEYPQVSSEPWEISRIW